MVVLLAMNQLKKLSIRTKFEKLSVQHRMTVRKLSSEHSLRDNGGIEFLVFEDGKPIFETF